MKKILMMLAALAAFSAYASGVPEETDAAQRLASMAAHEELPVTDARVVATAKTLVKISRATGEEPLAIAAACTRYSRHLFDAARIAASPLELLEALDRLGRKGAPINETLLRYVEARKAAPASPHGEVLAALSRK